MAHPALVVSLAGEKDGQPKGRGGNDFGARHPIQVWRGVAVRLHVLPRRLILGGPLTDQVVVRSRKRDVEGRRLGEPGDVARRVDAEVEVVGGVAVGVPRMMRTAEVVVVGAVPEGGGLLDDGHNRHSRLVPEPPEPFAGQLGIRKRCRASRLQGDDADRRLGGDHGVLVSGVVHVRQRGLVRHTGGAARVEPDVEVVGVAGVVGPQGEHPTRRHAFDGPSGGAVREGVRATNALRQRRRQ